MEMELKDIHVTNKYEEDVSDGLFHYRYIPKVGCPGEADFEGAIVTPPVKQIHIDHNAEASGKIFIFKSTWEQLPTFVNVVNRLAKLPIVEYRGAVVRSVRREVENTRQRILT